MIKSECLLPHRLEYFVEPGTPVQLEAFLSMSIWNLVAYKKKKKKKKTCMYTIVCDRSLITGIQKLIKYENLRMLLYEIFTKISTITASVSALEK